MPSKALLRTGHAVAAARRLPGVTADFDPAAVLARRDAFTPHWHDDEPGRVGRRRRHHGAARARARIDGERSVTVDGPAGAEELRARHAVVVCTGQRARPRRRCPGSTPSAPGPPGTRPRPSGSRRGWACSAAGWSAASWRRRSPRLGSAVTLVEHGPRLLAAMEPFAGERVAAALRADGVDVRLDRQLDSVAARRRRDRAAPGRRDGDRRRAAGGHRPQARTPTTSAWTPSGWSRAGRWRSTTPGWSPASTGQWLYAAGDVTGRAPLTHQGKYAARIVGGRDRGPGGGRAGGHRAVG